MNSRIHLVILVAVAAVVTVAARQTQEAPQAPVPAVEPAPAANPAPAPPNNLPASFSEAIAGVNQALQAEERRVVELKEPVEQERAQREAAEASRAATLNHAKQLRAMARERDRKNFKAKVQAMANENAVLIDEAIEREDIAIAVSHATADRRNQQQWDALSRFLTVEFTTVTPVDSPGGSGDSPAPT